VFGVVLTCWAAGVHSDQDGGDSDAEGCAGGGAGAALGRAHHAACSHLAARDHVRTDELLGEDGMM
jgi:hypothetical protein